MNINIGDNRFVRTSPASAYHKMHAEEVKVVAVNEHTSGKPENRVFTFIHPKYGPGALHAHGLAENLNFDLGSGNWNKDVAKTKPMFAKFAGQKFTALLGEYTGEDGVKIFTYMHSSLGFIAAYEHEIKNDIYIGER